VRISKGTIKNIIIALLISQAMYWSVWLYMNIRTSRWEKHYNASHAADSTEIKDSDHLLLKNPK
jgi:hypothetical protein